MGNATSSNYVDESVNLMTSVAINSTQSCQNSVQVNQNIKVVAKDGSTVNFDGIKITDIISINSICVQQSDIQTSIDTQISQAAQQLSKSLTGFLGSGDSEASNTANLYQTLSEKVSASFKKDCSQKLTINQSLDITATGESTVNVGAVDWENNVSDTLSCVQSDTDVTDIKNKISQKVKQKAEAITMGILGPLLGLIIAAVIIVVILVLGESVVGGGSKGGVIGIIISVLIIYIVIAYFEGWFPFKSSHKLSGIIKDVEQGTEGLLKGLI